MSTQSVLTIVGAAVGGYLGGPQGAQLGAALGACCGSSITPDDDGDMPMPQSSKPSTADDVRRPCR